MKVCFFILAAACLIGVIFTVFIKTDLRRTRVEGNKEENKSIHMRGSMKVQKILSMGNYYEDTQELELQ